MQYPAHMNSSGRRFRGTALCHITEGCTITSSHWKIGLDDDGDELSNSEEESEDGVEEGEVGTHTSGA